jgi:N-acetylmuramoyl-L-alanine amidase
VNKVVLRVKLLLLFSLLWTHTLYAGKSNILTDYYIDDDTLVLSFHKMYDSGSEQSYKDKKSGKLIFDFPHTQLSTDATHIKLKDISVTQPHKQMVRIAINVPSWYFVAGDRPLLNWKEFHIPLPLSVAYAGTQRNKPNLNTVASQQQNKKVVPLQKMNIEELTPINDKEVVQPQKMYESSNTLFSKIETSQKVLVNPTEVPKVVQNPTILPQVIAPKPSPKAIHKIKHKKVVVIDVGHGGHDPGAIGGGKKEKDVVLQVAKKTKKEIEKRGHKVYLTRETDRYLTLQQRTRMADKQNAAIFISLHANAIDKSKAHKIHGIETFFLQNTRDAKSQRIAARENAALLKGSSQTTKKVILDTVLSGPKIVESNKLAIAIHGRMIKNVKAHYKGVVDGGVRHAPFYVLVGASRPSVLVEVGYISHPQERKRIFSPRYQTYLARGIAQGIDSYLYFREKELGF